MVVVVLQICLEQAAPQKLTATKKLLPGASLGRIKSCRNEQARNLGTVPHMGTDIRPVQSWL